MMNDLLLPNKKKLRFPGSHPAMIKYGFVLYNQN